MRTLARPRAVSWAVSLPGERDARPLPATVAEVTSIDREGGVVGLTKNAGLEYGPQKIRVNAVGPGFIKTPLLDKNLTPEAMKFLEGQHAMGRLGQVGEVAELVVWLASDKASFVTGAYYAVDGGYLAQ